MASLGFSGVYQKGKVVESLKRADFEAVSTVGQARRRPRLPDVSDFTLQPHHTLIVGMTGSGKTTFVNRLLLNDDTAAVRLIYDDLNRMWPRLKLRPCFTPAELRDSPGTGWSAFVAGKMLFQFNGDGKKVFRWWLRWVWDVARSGPGRKLVIIPEIWRHCNPDTIPPELALLAQAGRELGVELVCDTQRPELLNGSLTGAATEMVCFRQMSPAAWRVTEKLLWETGNAFDPAQLRALPPGSFVSFNRISGGALAGRVF